MAGIKSYRLVVAALAALCMWGAQAAPDRLAREVKFEIPAQPLSTALVQFSKQADLQLVTASVELGAKETKGVSGRLSLRKALLQLLNQTGLSYSLVGDNTIAIAVNEPEQKSAPKGQAGAATAGRGLAFMLALADTTPQAADAKAAVPQPSDEEAAENARGIPQILVQGTRDKTRSLNVDLPRSEDDAKPYYIFDSKTIQTSGVANLQDFLFQRLPMNTESMPLSQHLPTNVGAGLATVSMVSLRGLGTDQTLILVNGRRLSTVSVRGVDRQPDINGIPLSAVDRIEVLPSSASGIYGGGAVGGVINIVLRRDYAGGEVKVNYANTFDADSPRTRYEATSGFSLEEGRTNLLVSATYSDAKPMRRGDRLELFQKGRDRYLASNPLSIASPPLGSTPNIYSATGAPLTLKDGDRPLGSNYTHIPVGYTGVASDGGQALIDNAGSYNYAYADMEYIGLQQPTNSAFRTKALQFNVRREMTSNLELFVDSSYTVNITPMKRGSLLSALRIPSSSALNPFNEEVLINFPGGPAAPMNSESTVTRVSAGGILKLPRGWQLQGDYAISEGDNWFDLGSGLSTSMVAAVAAGTLNPFVDTQTYPVDLSPYLQQFVGDYGSSLRDITFRFAGPLWTLPGGEIALATNLSSRSQKQLPSTETFLSTAAPENNYVDYYLEQAQRTDSVYAELTIPLFGRKNAIPGIRMLDLQLAGRHEIYRVKTLTTPTGARQYRGPTAPALTSAETRYDSTNPTIGLRYKPIEDVMLRASLSTAFRPPLYYMLQPGNRSASNNTNIIDPLRDDAPTAVYTLGGGNPDVQPEDGENWHFGVVFTPRAVPGLRLAADYVRIKKTNNIATLGAQVIVDNEAIYPDRVIRDTVAPGDPYGVGPILEVETSYLNLYGSKVESIDFSASYTMETASFGSFTLSALATRNLHYIQQLSAAVPSREYVDTPAVSGGSVKFKGNATLSWDRGPWTGSWTTYYYSDYGQYGPPFTTSMVYLNPQGGLGARIPAQHFHDMFMGYRFADAGVGANWRQQVLDRVEMQLGIRNLFNKPGAFDAYFSFNGYMSPWARLELRTYWLNLSKGF